ncbi:DsbA family protein [Phenylobacterium sp.]|uniref:DsbA family protein n=1 Tax=Phenylobacterium sp. TaxID=1871053 RepID=UPI0025CF4710|nr:DsbA family protein [Phenylobacterium sp.]MCA6285758.1 DsbA family protein [Phenylobacterium sp.]MCA6310046.1 DsbA family protein [Phenylobacterium sp.]MCA6324355.1 DsbA family protein [Phenylobacterium sp.]MCA6336856.1 DsbA family protein [Phenylobacterium sp.]MCA6339453.1 DsbA family protein [Phenylobacterium sp.]
MSRFKPLALVALAGALLLAACTRGPAPSAEDMTLGDPKATVKMVEYASASCVHCATFNNEVFPAFKAKYIDTGKVHYTLKEFLTPPNELAAASFLTARCAGKDKYFTVLDAVFRSQQEIFQTGDMRGVLLRIAQSAGLTEAQFNACITDEAALKSLNERVERAVKQDRIASTPAFFINGKAVASGEISLAALEKAVAEASK